MAQVLEMTFKNAANKNFTISLDAPRTNLTAEEVKTAMNNIIAKNIFNTSGGDVVEIGTARIVDTDVTEFELGL